MEAVLDKTYDKVATADFGAQCGALIILSMVAGMSEAAAGKAEKTEADVREYVGIFDSIAAMASATARGIEEDLA